MINITQCIKTLPKPIQTDHIYNNNNMPIYPNSFGNHKFNQTPHTSCPKINATTQITKQNKNKYKKPPKKEKEKRRKRQQK